MRPEKTGYAVLAACVLHNFLRQRAKSSYNPASSVKTEGLDTGEVSAGDRRQLNTSDGPRRHGARNACREAKRCSLQNENCFMNAGQVTCQQQLLSLVISSLQKNQQLAIPLRHVFNKFTNNPLHQHCAACI
jgi:hypothetical protein